MISYGYVAIDAKAWIGASYGVAAFVVLATGWLSMPAVARLQFKPVRSVGRFLADQALRLAVIAYVFALFFAISWRPIYSCLGTISFFVIFASISRAKFNFIREPLIFTDLALVLDVLKYKEIFYATWLNKLFWIGAALYVFGVSALFMALEPSLLPEDQALQAYAFGFAGWLFPFALVFWRPVRLLVCKLSRLAVGSHDLRGNVIRFGAFEYITLNFLMWFGTVRVSFVDDLADDLDQMLQRLLAGKDQPAPLIVVWQSESFLDIRRLGLESVSLPNMDALRRRASRWGLLRNVFEGGYTMRTEFSVLSGLKPEAIGLDASYPYLHAKDYCDVAWPMRLRRAGWHTHFIHPYDRTFFRRHRAMPELGFSQMTMLEHFDHRVSPENPYVRDLTLAKRVANICKEQSPSDPAFLFVASMGNHGPWHDGRVAAAVGPVDIYCRLLEEADAALGALVRELDTLQRPVWLVFYGDHAPLLKDFADPFPDPRTDYAIAPLATASQDFRFDNFRADINSWNLIGHLAQVAGLRPIPGKEASEEPAARIAPTR
jgi:phosphoglycerol transferase MdoB-like AlkP superfamily enzyme